MSSRRPVTDISCSRCKSKKIRCNKAHPRCDKCQSIDARCIYLPRKARDKKPRGVHDKDILSDILSRLDRLERQSAHESRTDEEDGFSSRSLSFVQSNNNRQSSPPTQLPGRSTSSHSLHSDLLYQLRYAGRNLVENEVFSKAMRNAMMEIETSTNWQERDLPINPPPLSKEMAKRWAGMFFDSSQCEGFRCPLEKDFVLSIPDLLEIRHVKLDSTCLIIYYNSVLQGMMIDTEPVPNRGVLVQHLYRKCTDLVDRWRSEAQNTYVDFYAAFLMMPMSLEGCNIEEAWNVYGDVCRIAKALGYFTIDEVSSEGHDDSAEDKSGISDNRKRLEFWYLLQTDCLFRFYFGRPGIISRESWVVNFPNATIEDVDDPSTRFIQIHFLASMRLTLVLLKYLDLVDNSENVQHAGYDETLDRLAEEVVSITSTWKVEELLETTTTTFDSWFCADIVFNGFKILIILHGSKKCNQQNQSAPKESVDIARTSILKMKYLISTAPRMHWGTSQILLHQFVPFLNLCSNIIDAHKRSDIESDLALVMMVSDFVRREAMERIQLEPIRILMKAMAEACQQIALDLD